MNVTASIRVRVLVFLVSIHMQRTTRCSYSTAHKHVAFLWDDVCKIDKGWKDVVSRIHHVFVLVMVSAR